MPSRFRARAQAQATERLFATPRISPFRPSRNPAKRSSPVAVRLAPGCAGRRVRRAARVWPRIVVIPGGGYTPLETAPRRPGAEPLRSPVQTRVDARMRAEASPDRLHELLLTGTPREVLARIVPEDPLELRARVGARISERALLLEVEHVTLRAQALCSLHAAAWRGEPGLEEWLDRRVEEALAAALSEEEGERRGAEDLALFPAPRELDPLALASSCARFNDLPFEQREAFLSVVLDAGAVDRLARARRLSLSELARRARAGLEVFRRTARASRT